MVATKDDFLNSRGTEFDSARDNVVFEYGLFLGRVGPGRAFVIQEEGTKIPSDLYGSLHLGLKNYQIWFTLTSSIMN
jgi:predicted nucleotide-binding protein